MDVDSLKQACEEMVFQSISPVKANDIRTIVKSLTRDEGDILIKYIYKLMAKPATFNPSVLLAWHEKLVAENGVGTIVRCLTDHELV